MNVIVEEYDNLQRTLDKVVNRNLARKNARTSANSPEQKIRELVRDLSPMKI